MQSKNKKAMTIAERCHVMRVKEQPCSLCDEGGGEGSPSEAHEIKQGQWFTSVAWCAECHRGPAGWHGTKVLFHIAKMDELDCLNVTISRLAK